jgi:hypothetical protein
VSTYQLVLHYHPKGIYGRVSECIREAKVKYATYVPPPGQAEWDVPCLWTGPPRTPPATPPSKALPPAPVKGDWYETEEGKAALEARLATAYALPLWAGVPAT